MKILILGLNYAPERVGIAVYTTGMAEALAAMGHQVQVISGQPYYPAWKIMAGHNAFAFSRNVENGVDITRVPHYVPDRPSGLKRILHHLSFAISSLAPALWRARTWRPDIVMAIAPSLIAAPAARLAARMSGARSWLHIQDFEVEAAFVMGMLDSKSTVAKLANWFERAAMAGFDTVSSISPQMCAKLADKGIARNRIYEFRNWSTLDVVAPLDTSSPYRAEWNIRTSHVALYSGNIGNKQGVEIVIDAARTLRHRRDLTFIICGEGPNRAHLQALSSGLTNIQFHDLQPKDRLNDLVALATVHLLPQRAGVADLVLPSKLANILASGRPVVVTAEAGTGLAAEVEGCGLLVSPEDALGFAGAIADLLDHIELWQTSSALARRKADTRWSATSILTALNDTLRESDTAKAEAAE